MSEIKIYKPTNFLILKNFGVYIGLIIYCQFLEFFLLNHLISWPLVLPNKLQVLVLLLLVKQW